MFGGGEVKRKRGGTWVLGKKKEKKRSGTWVVGKKKRGRGYTTKTEGEEEKNGKGRYFGSCEKKN